MDSRANKKIRFSTLGFISGGVLGLGGVVMMQQYGRFVISPARLAQAVALALVFGLIVPTILQLIGNKIARPTAALAATAAVLAISVVSMTGAGVASAQSDCALSINGQSAVGGATIVVNETEDLEATFTGTEVTGGVVAVKFAGFEVYSQTMTLADTVTGSETRTIDRTSIVDKGVGMYSVTGTVMTNSGNCTFDFNVHIKGAPLSTPAGLAAAAATGLGGLGTAISVARQIAQLLSSLRVR